jgi:hypothetical protein
MAGQVTARKVDTGRSGTRRYVVELLVDGKVVGSAGGNRAARANYVLARQYTQRETGALITDLYGLRVSPVNDKWATLCVKIDGVVAGKAPAANSGAKCADCKHAAMNHRRHSVAYRVDEEWTPGSGLFTIWNHDGHWKNYCERDSYKFVYVPYCHSCWKNGKVCRATREEIRAQ